MKRIILTFLLCAIGVLGIVGFKNKENVDDKKTVIDARNINLENKDALNKLTLDELKEIVSKKGSNLTWGDFEKYSSRDVGFGLYILLYEINDDYNLYIGGPSVKEVPLYIFLKSKKDEDKFIDVREENIDDFLSATECNMESKIDEQREISVSDVMDKINNYFEKNLDKNNSMAYWAIDGDRDVVVVGMMDISEERQDKFIDDVFTDCCGLKYIQYIRENKMIEFRESIDIFEGKIISSQNDNITVEVLEKSKSFKKGDKVTMKITRPTSGVNDFYVKGNNVRITFNGMVEDSNPAQISAAKIELITE